MNKVKLAKLAARSVASFGVGVIVHAAINNQFPEGLPTYKRIGVIVATAVVVDMSQAAIKKHTEAMIDEGIREYKKMNAFVAQSKQRIKTMSQAA